MGKTWKHEKLDKKPRQVEKKVPKKVRYEDFVQSVSEMYDEDLEEYPEMEIDTCLQSRSILN